MSESERVQYFQDKKQKQKNDLKEKLKKKMIEMRKVSEVALIVLYILSLKLHLIHIEVNLVTDFN